MLVKTITVYGGNVMTQIIDMLGCNNIEEVLENLEQHKFIPVMDYFPKVSRITNKPMLDTNGRMYIEQADTEFPPIVNTDNFKRVEMFTEKEHPIIFEGNEPATDNVVAFPKKRDPDNA